MTDDFTLSDIEPSSLKAVPSAAQMTAGIPIPPVRIIQVYSADEWEAFTEEWLHFHKLSGKYEAVRRFAGPGDRGLDVIGFTSAVGFSSEWDSYQCKHYDHALSPEDVSIEIAKIIHHSFLKAPPYNQTHGLPRKHVFVAPRGSGITVARWFKDQVRFKAEIRDRWKKNGLPTIGKGISTDFNGEIEAYFEAFDFSIFGDKSAVELIDEHSHTAFHAARFGGGLPARGAVPEPPATPSADESPYLKKLFDTYGEHVGKSIADRGGLHAHAALLEHFDRQRVLFYSAEALRNFARDRTPVGTFDSLKDDVYHGVIDVCETVHTSGLERLRSTIVTAGGLDVSGNALVGVTRVADKQGVCHHLANEDRLTWVRDDD